MDGQQTSGYTGHASGSKTEVIELIDKLNPGFWDKAAPVLTAMDQQTETIPNGCLLSIQDRQLVSSYDFDVVGTARSGTNPFARNGPT